MFKRKGKKNLPDSPSTPVSEQKKTLTKHEEKKLQALAKKAQKAEEKESPVQLVSVKRTARIGEDGGEGKTAKPNKSREDTATRSNKPAPLPSQTQSSASKVRPALKAQSSVHIFSTDSVTSSTSFDFGGESRECDEETVKFSFEEDKREYEFEVVPTSHPNVRIMRNRLDSVPSPRINCSYEL